MNKRSFYYQISHGGRRSSGTCCGATVALAAQDAVNRYKYNYAMSPFVGEIKVELVDDVGDGRAVWETITEARDCPSAQWWLRMFPGTPCAG